MKRTPQYGLSYGQQGDKYSAARDLDRNVVVDNQLLGLSSAVTDGVMSGWTLSKSGLNVNVAPGSGFISRILHRTFSKRVATLQADSLNYVYMQSRMLSGSGGLEIEAESPRSDVASATLVDTTAPAAPTGLLADAVSFDTVNLTWNASSETDLDHYNVYRGLAVGGPFTLVASPAENGVSLSSPFRDTGLSASVHYYYRVTAVDLSGNESGPDAANVSTSADSRVPPEVGGLSAFPANGTISLVYQASTYPADLFSEYLITISRLAADGTILSSSTVSNGTSLFYQAVGLDNGFRYRFTVKSRTVASVDSAGTSIDATPSVSAAPLDVTGVVVTPGIRAVTLDWTASSSTTGTSIGEKSKYRIRVINGNSVSFPIDAGLATSRKITSFAASTSVGAGLVQTLDDSVQYVFRITTMDAFGNESVGTYAKGGTIDSTPPNDPRSLTANGLDSSISISWKHSSSTDVEGYSIAVDVGSGFGSDVEIGYLRSYLATGLTNGVLTRVMVRARDFAGNLSQGSSSAIGTAIPTADVVPPDVPAGLAATSKDTEVFLTWNASGAPDFSFFTLKRVAVKETPNVPRDRTLTPKTGIGPSSGTSIRNLGTSVELLDCGLVNGQTYAYYLSATDSTGNQSEYGPPILVQPSVGISQISKPSLLAAGGTSITLNWTAVVEDHTAYNIYRSSNPTYGFEFADSVAADVTTFVDGDIPGMAYYYQVSAVSDNAEVVVDTGSVAPPNSVLLGTVKTSTPVRTVNAQRIIEGIQAVIFDETTSRLLAHRHAVAPINSVTISAVGILALVDAVNLAAIDLTTLLLSDDALAYYKGLLKDAAGKDIKYDQGVTFFISPSSVAGDLPFVGDFQLLVDGQLPTDEYSIDHSRNCFGSTVPIPQTSAVTIDGKGLSYYVPANISSGLSVLVNGTVYGTAAVDIAVQTVRFSVALDSAATVAVVLEPKIPDFTGTVGARQVSLEPKIVLNDFSSVDGSIFRSESGAFDGSDTMAVLVNGETTSLPHAIDVVEKAVVFDAPLPDGSTVALEISNREEVRDLLPTTLFGDLDASQVTKKKFIKQQLATISHQGRIGETALPTFEAVSTTDRYSYSGTKDPVGTATTPYAFFSDDFGQLTIGTSNGVLRTSGFDSFVSGSDASSATIDTTVNVNGITISRVNTDDVVKAANDCVEFSGRFQGTIPITVVSSGQLVTTGEINSPSLTLMDDGRVLVSGGDYYDDNRSYYFETSDCFIYNPATKAMSKTASMHEPRATHASVRLPNGNIMVSGGAQSTDLAYGQTFEVIAATFTVSKTCEIFDIASQKWTTVASMGTTRRGHGFTVMSQTEILVSGGFVTDTWFDDRSNNNSGPATVSETCEIYDIDADLFSPTGSMNRARTNHSAKLAAPGSVIVETQGLGRELYSRASELWTLVGGSTEQTQTVLQDGLAIEAIDGVVKSFFSDSDDILYALTRNGVFFAKDRETFVKMKGLETVGVVHAIGESGGTLFAATDLGVYEITPDIKDKYTWFQGGLIGAGTTETFDLLEFGGAMYAGTEIGLFRSSDSGDTWTDVGVFADGGGVGDVYNVEAVGQRMYVQSDSSLLYSDDISSWTKKGRFDFLDRDSILMARSTDLFVGSTDGLWVSSDAGDFKLVDFDRNRDAATNGVTMLGLFGSDVIAGYDNEMYAVGLDLGSIRLAQFVGTVPTVLINGVEERAFRYDNQRSSVEFEFKRLFGDEIQVATGYFEFHVDSWYSEAPNAPVTVYVDGKEQSYADYSVEPRTGKITFQAPLSKGQAVTASISGTTLDGGGELYHDEIEDRMSEADGGLSLSMERDRSGDLLQFGLSFEHNFLERGLERNQYYCLSGTNVDRGMTAFLSNAEFYILGRRDFDSFNSTIDYVRQSEGDGPGEKAFAPLSAFEYSATKLWIGTENGIFSLDPTASFSATTLLPGEQVNGMANIGSETWVVVADRVLQTVDGVSFSENAGSGLPDSLLCLSSVGGVPMLGTLDAIYYSDDMSSEEFDSGTDGLVAANFSVWFRATFADQFSMELFVTSPCRVIISAQGTAYAAIDNAIYLSTDGKAWSRAYQFPDGYSVSSMAYFSYKLYVGTNKGVWTDHNSIRSKSATMTLERLQGDVTDLSFSVNDLAAGTDALYAVGDRPYLYSLKDGTWSRTTVPGVDTIHKVYRTSGGRTVAVSNDSVFSE